jgi:hypothetical protein
MAETKTGDPVPFLDLLLDYFADATGWTQGDLDDGRGRRCVVGAIHHLRCKYQIPSRAAENLLEQVLPAGYCHLASFNDGCANVAELRALIVNARTLALVAAEQRPERATAAQFGRWQILMWRKRARAARAATGNECGTSDPERLAA